MKVETLNIETCVKSVVHKEVNTTLGLDRAACHHHRIYGGWCVRRVKFIVLIRIVEF